MQNLKLLAATLVVTIVLIAGAAWLFSGNTQQANQLAQTEVPIEELVPEGSFTRGASDSARFTIVEFSDLQCPACKAVQPYVQFLVNRYPNDVRLVFRHFPLLSIHQNSQIAAQAAEAAGRQGKFWEMHDLLFETQETWSTGNPLAHFSSLVEQLELDPDQFMTDLDSQEVKTAVERDLRQAEQYGLNGTPSFFLNGKRMNFEDIRNQIQSELGE